MRKVIKAFEVMNLGIADGFFLNLFDEAFQHPQSHPELLHTKGGEEPREKVHMDFNILKSLRGILGMFPEFIEMLL